MSSIPWLSVPFTLLLCGACSADGGEPGKGPTGPGPGGTAAPTGTVDPTLGIVPPAERKSCEPGVYRGDFSGQVSLIGIALDAKGTVVLTLSAKEGSTGEFRELVIENGVVEGAAGSGTYRADIIGTLDCASLQIVNGGLLNGVYNGFPPLAFEGPVTGRYVLDTHAFVDGTWAIADPQSKSPLGGGVWAAVLTP